MSENKGYGWFTMMDMFEKSWWRFYRFKEEKFDQLLNSLDTTNFKYDKKLFKKDLVKIHSNIGKTLEAKIIGIKGITISNTNFIRFTYLSFSFFRW